jgi:uncharacterized protein (TIGR01777 family)
MRIILAGGSGQVGQMLARRFHAQGHDVDVLGRFPCPAPWKMTAWNGRDLAAWADAIDGSDLIINLTGRSVHCRYNTENRREILETRVNSTRVIAEAIRRAVNPPTLWLNAATATIYRHSLNRDMDEFTGEIGAGFSVDVAKAWEQSFFDANTPATRKIALRSSMIMSPDRGGVLDVLMGLVKRGLGGKAGSGAQYVSWIHCEDFIRALEFLITNTGIDGAVNICSPNPLPNVDFMAALRDAYRTPAGLPAPKWMLEIGALFLRTETELILKSRRVVPRRLLDAGFEFFFPDWPTAAEDLVRRWERVRSSPTF